MIRFLGALGLTVLELLLIVCTTVWVACWVICVLVDWVGL